MGQGGRTRTKTTVPVGDASTKQAESSSVAQATSQNQPGQSKPNQGTSPKSGGHLQALRDVIAHCVLQGQQGDEKILFFCLYSFGKVSL